MLHTLFTQFLTESGDGTGPNSFIGDYSASPLKVSVRAQANELEVHALVIFITDVSSATFKAHKFGNMAALQSGITVELAAGIEIKTRLTGSDAVLTNGDMIRTATCFSEMPGNPRALRLEWNFTETSGQPFRILPLYNEEMRVVLSDDFTDLRSLQFVAYGHTIVDPSSRLSF